MLRLVVKEATQDLSSGTYETKNLIGAAIKWQAQQYIIFLINYVPLNLGLGPVILHSPLSSCVIITILCEHYYLISNKLMGIKFGPALIGTS